MVCRWSLMSLRLSPCRLWPQVMPSLAAEDLRAVFMWLAESDLGVSQPVTSRFSASQGNALSKLPLLTWPSFHKKAVFSEPKLDRPSNIGDLPPDSQTGWPHLSGDKGCALSQHRDLDFWHGSFSELVLCLRWHLRLLAFSFLVQMLFNLVAMVSQLS